MKRLTVNTFALQSLKKRKKQYAALIVGVILAMVFSSGTLFFVSCLSSSKKEIRRRDFGTADQIAFELTEENFRQLVGENPGVEYGVAHMLGFAYTEEQEEGAAVGWLDETAREYYQPVILEGRWPEKEGEIAAERDALLRMGLADAKPGDALTLNLLVQNGPGERSETPVAKRYTLAGILGDKRKNLTLGYPDSNQYLPALLASDKEPVELGGKEALTAYIKTPPKSELKLNAAAMAVDASSSWQMFNDLTEQTIYPTLLSGVLTLASGLGIVNAFNTDLRERKRQIGLLRAVGATKRQIVALYGRETLLLGLICAPVSLCLSYFSVKFITHFMENFIFLPSWGVLAGSTAVSLLFVLLASLIPLTAAARVSPMQAIRNTELGRKMRRMKIRSKTQFDVSRLLAGRNLRFYRFRTVLTALILAATVFLSSYAFTFFLDQSSGANPAYSDYFIGLSHDQMYQPYMNFTGGYGYTENDKQALLNCPGVASVRGRAEIYTVAQFPEESDYWRIAKYCWWGTLFFDDYQERDMITPQNYREKLDGAVSSDWRAFQEQLELTGTLVPLPVKSREADQLMEEYDVQEGRIDTDKLDSGEEIILIAPDELGFWMQDNGEYGYSSEVYATDGAQPGWGEPLETAKRSIHAGDTVTLTTVTSRPTEDAKLSSDYARTDRTVTVGAVCREKHDIPYEASSFCGFCTTTKGMRLLSDSFKYKNLTVTMAGDVTDETDEYMSAVIDRITSGVPAYVYSAFQWANQERADRRQATIAVLAIVILMLSIAGSMINNALTARIREGKREIGTLRAVGANASDLTRSYVRELLFMTGFGSAVGFAAFLLLWFGAGFLDWLQWRYTPKPVFDPLHIWQTALGVLALFAVCAANLRLQIRKHMKNSIVENIREL